MKYTDISFLFFTRAVTLFLQTNFFLEAQCAKQINSELPCLARRQGPELAWLSSAPSQGAPEEFCRAKSFQREQGEKPSLIQYHCFVDKQHEFQRGEEISPCLSKEPQSWNENSRLLISSFYTSFHFIHLTLSTLHLLSTYCVPVTILDVLHSPFHLLLYLPFVIDIICLIL